MSYDKDNFSIDDILAEFSSFSSSLTGESETPVQCEEAPAYEAPQPAYEEAVYEAPAYEPAAPEYEPKGYEAGYEESFEPAYEEAYKPVKAEAYDPPYKEPYAPSHESADGPAPVEEEPVVDVPRPRTPPRRATLSGVNRGSRIDMELLGYAKPESENKNAGKARKFPLPKPKAPKAEAELAAGTAVAVAAHAAENIAPTAKVEKGSRKANKPAAAEKKAEAKQEKAPVDEPTPAKSGKGGPINLIKNFIGLIFAVLSVISLFWLLMNVHPDSGSITNSTTDSKLDLVGRLNVYMNNAASDTLGELSYIKKIYTIEESAVAAPRPNPSCYGSTTNPADIDAVIEQASELIGDQTLSWDPNVDFFPGSEINYYLDDTILVIAWKEVRENKVCTCSEVIIAHGSQLRRKLAGDAYGSSVQVYATKMATEANSVIAINGDFYAFRNLGITGYQRQIYRVNPATVDSCFFTADGDMLFAYAGQLMGEGEAQRFMDENDCTFAIAFGPVLVDNGELRKIESYPIGEINTTYSRAAIGMLGERHYFLMTINYEDNYNKTSTVHQLGEFMYQKGCQKAYTLDGGQTSVMVMQGETLNKVDWGEERIMSDIIYFATAVPEQEVTQ